MPLPSADSQAAWDALLADDVALAGGVADDLRQAWPWPGARDTLRERLAAGLCRSATSTCSSCSRPTKASTPPSRRACSAALHGALPVPTPRLLANGTRRRLALPADVAAARHPARSTLGRSSRAPTATAWPMRSANASLRCTRSTPRRSPTCRRAGTTSSPRSARAPSSGSARGGSTRTGSSRSTVSSTAGCRRPTRAARCCTPS